MAGSIVQISTSRGGVPKHAISSAEVNTLGIIGDVCAHPGIHGGPLQALLLITSEGIDELIAQGFPLFHGALGENLTTRGLDRRALRLGQRFRISEIIIELTRVRAPCDQLNPYGPGIQRAIYDLEVRAGEARSTLWGLSGFYTSVIQPGTIRTGDSVELL